MTQFLPLLLWLIVWVGYVGLLAVVPWWYPPLADLPNVAAVLGYNIDLAYLLVIGWTGFMGLVVAGVLRSMPMPPAFVQASHPGPGPVQRWLERGVVALGALIFYWPGALARFGPHIEDVYFLNVLWRRVCGAIAYRDFEFLYGPLMLAPAEAAIALLGFSMQSYFIYLALLQMIFYVVLITLIQRYLPRAVPRYLAFLLILPFVIDLLYGLNWIPWRYFGVVLALLVLSARPRAFGAVVGAGVILGLQAAYSHEYGIAGLVSGLAVLGLGLFEPCRGKAAGLMTVLIFTSLTCWVAIVLALTGSDAATYLEATALVMAEASSKGLGQFAFYWTGHSLALFAVLACMVILGGIGVGRLGRVRAARGDRHLVGALVFVVITLKIGFQRADFLHMAVPFIPLALMLLLGAERRLLVSGPLLPRLSIAALVVAALAQAVGHMPQGRWAIYGLVRGVLHEIQNRPKAEVAPDARAGILGERADPKPASEALAVRLAAPDLVGRPVLFYGRLWDMPVETGVCPVGYAFYDLLYTNDRAPMADLTDTIPDLLVALHHEDAAVLIDGKPAEDKTLPVLTGIKRLARLVASPHYDQSYLEVAIEARMWRNALGGSLAGDYRLYDRVGDVVLLESYQ